MLSTDNVRPSLFRNFTIEFAEKVLPTFSTMNFTTLFPDLKLYVYASTEEILWKALVETDLFDELKNGNYEDIKITDGDILNILPDGTLVYDKFDYTDYSYYGRCHWWDYGTHSDSSDPYIEDLKMIAAYQGFDEDTIDELLGEGLTPEEIEEFIYCCE